MKVVRYCRYSMICQVGRTSLMEAWYDQHPSLHYCSLNDGSVNGDCCCYCYYCYYCYCLMLMLKSMLLLLKKAMVELGVMMMMPLLL